MVRMAMCSLGLAACLIGPRVFAEETATSDAKQTNEQLIQIKKQLAEMTAELKKLTNTRWEYQVITQDRRKTRSFNELLNELNKEGWNFVTDLGNEGFLFRRAAQ
jgi:hypothetical protein